MQKIAKYTLGAFIGIGLLLMIYCLGFESCFSLEKLKKYTIQFDHLVAEHYERAVLVYILLFAGLIIGAFPLIGPVVIVGGYSFGVLFGTIYSCIAATGASMVTFALVRHIFVDFIQKRYADRLRLFNEHIRREGASYLLMLHFLLVPFFIINAFAAVTPISWWTFVWTTIVGTVPIFIVYALAGRQFRLVESVRHVFSWPIIALLILFLFLALLPILIRRWYRWYRQD